MTRRLLSSHLRHLLNPTTPPNPKPYFPTTSQQNLISQSRFLPWQIKPNRSLYFSAFKPSKWLFLAKPRYIVQTERLLTHRSQWQRSSFQPLDILAKIIYSVRKFGSKQIFTPDGVVLFIIGVNVAVFILWRIADPTFMINHFTVSLDNIKNGRLHTVITSAFSHPTFATFAGLRLTLNMTWLYAFGGNIARNLGPNFLLKLYFGGALGGSLFFLVHCAFSSYQGYSERDTSYARVTGATAAADAIMLLDLLVGNKLYAYRYPHFRITTVATVVAPLIAYHLWTVHKAQGPVSNTARLGGDFVAVLVWARVRKRI